MFRSHRLYTHKKMLDAAIYVEKVQYVGPNYAKVRITWYNQRGIRLGMTETIKITKNEYKNWYEI